MFDDWHSLNFKANLTKLEMQIASDQNDYKEYLTTIDAYVVYNFH